MDATGVSMAVGESTAVSVIPFPRMARNVSCWAGNANDAWDASAIRDTISCISTAAVGSILTVGYEVPAEVVRLAA